MIQWEVVKGRTLRGWLLAWVTGMGHHDRGSRRVGQPGAPWRCPTEEEYTLWQMYSQGVRSVGICVLWPLFSGIGGAEPSAKGEGTDGGIDALGVGAQVPSVLLLAHGMERAGGR